MQAMIPESLRLLVVGLNYRTAPLEVREALSFTRAQAAAATTRLHDRFANAEAVILSTCNRVEIYVARPVSAEPSLEDLSRFIAEFHGVADAQLRTHLYQRQDRAMVEHLFNVASSLDSMVVGETQILSQVKHAYQHACDAGGVGKVLHALFQRALAAAKDVHDRTELSRGRLSVASVAADLAASVFDRFDDKTVVCVGAGKMATLLLTHLAELKPRRLLVTNRTPERARTLADGFHAEARPFDELDQMLIEADILLTSTGATTPIVTEAQFKGLLKLRRYRPIVIVDIAVPRDVEAGVAKLANVYLYNIDDLQDVVAGNRGQRDREIEAARQLLQTHVEEYLKWFASRDVGPLVKALYERCNEIGRVELEAAVARNPAMTDQERAELERLTHRLIGKILHEPVTQLTSQAEATARPMLAAALKKLFHLDSFSPP